MEAFLTSIATSIFLFIFYKLTMKEVIITRSFAIASLMAVLVVTGINLMAVNFA